MALMVELRPMLARHFKAEERAGGLFQGLLKLRPDRIESIEALRSQHRSILDDIEAILALVDADDAALRALVADFLDRIGEHERAENALVMSCLMG